MLGMQIRDLRKMAELSDRLVAPSQWVFSALAANGVPAEKIFVSRQAVADSFVSLGAAYPWASGRPVGQATPVPAKPQ